MEKRFITIRFPFLGIIEEFRNLTPPMTASTCLHPHNITTRCSKVGGKRIVLDTIESLFSGLSNDSILRAEFRRLFLWLKSKEPTAMITSLQLAEEILRLRPGIPVILCAGYSEVIDEQKKKQAGISAVLMKPAHIKELMETVQKVLF